MSHEQEPGFRAIVRDAGQNAFAIVATPLLILVALPYMILMTTGRAIVMTVAWPMLMFRALFQGKPPFRR